eukprot:TRINITY_DN5927_c0_g2_i1.p1 TRINITY_DN5927_c0_g2~~TRINITY_DN5927_c0_g2_i1.p1  ORF type:complete len:257 (+),score=61.88 TRINITY_DN5927_c0_g2_i1:173-943(+)
MLVKEYRIVLPFSVEEYQRAQIYMVAKVSKGSTSHGEGVQVLVNEPFENENGKGQFTHKLIFIGSRIPGWLRYLMPASVLQVEEKSWNAYPYCKTEYTCPFLGSKFSITIETKYIADNGTNDEVFPDRKEKVEVDVVDIVNDTIDASKYKAEEDPKLYTSKKSGRGPLEANWRETHKPIMCSYKTCSVNFSYWGLQSRVESFIHKYGLRDVFLLGHRQIFCWTDEWWDLSIESLRQVEKEMFKEMDQALHEDEKEK